MTLSKKKKNFVPYMVHLEPAQIKELKRKSKSESKSISATVRDAITAKLSDSGDPWQSGFIEGLKRAATVAKRTEGAQMKFPDGKSFADKVCEEIEKIYI
jgi:hypothetical protein